MIIEELITSINYVREQKAQAKQRFNLAEEPELIDAAIFEMRAWEERYKYLNRKLREAFRNEQEVPSQRFVQFRDRS